MGFDIYDILRDIVESHYDFGNKTRESQSAIYSQPPDWEKYERIIAERSAQLDKLIEKIKEKITNA